MSTAWYIYGKGGYGMETLDILEENIEDDKIHKAYYLDDDNSAEQMNGTKVVSFSPELEGFVTISIGEPAIRTKLYEKIVASKLKPKSVISSSALVSKHAVVGEGCIIAPMCSIQSTAVLKNNVAVNTAAIIGHDVIVEESSVISSQVNLGGGVTVGRESYIGMGALIKEGVKIGENVIIGMGSVVYKDIPDGVIAIGNPARPLKKNVDKKVFG
jgi:sugar O-acyltransferase (sialic acid O-acetyltransferase NeuD family)